VLLATASHADLDTVEAIDGDGEEIGVLVDGYVDADFHNDDVYRGPDGTPIEVGPYNQEDGENQGPGETIAYTVGHVPTLADTPWDAWDNDFQFEFDDLYSFKLVVWVVHHRDEEDGGLDATKMDILTACTETVQIWTDERAGVGFHDAEIHDVSDHGDASVYADFEDCDVSAPDWGIKDLGFEEGALNVYWVDRVDGSTGRGCWSWWSTSGSATHVGAIGSNASASLLAHEIGHAFDLAHADDVGGGHFDDTNVMWSASNARSYLTEGQTFRATFNAFSAVNTLAGRGGATRDCPEDSTSEDDEECPAVQKRIWADGSFPAE
jgi:hypothetical protein